MIDKIPDNQRLDVFYDLTDDVVKLLKKKKYVVNLVNTPNGNPICRYLETLYDNADDIAKYIIQLLKDKKYKSKDIFMYRVVHIPYTGKTRLHLCYENW